MTEKKDKDYDNWIIIVAVAIFVFILRTVGEYDLENIAKVITATGSLIIGMIGVSTIMIVKKLKDN
ncbi:hypothetical protein KAI56_04470 [Candidatus Parcubacteria bacterium]|nr:hypothetical protein [Candidatus Parcubacteria bacterium]